MFRRFSADFAIFSIFLDWISILLSLFLSATIRYSFNSFEFIREVSQPVVLPWVLFLLFPILWIGVLLVFSVYDGRRNLRVVDEFASMTLGSMLAAIAMAGILYFSFRDVSRFLMIFFISLAWVMMIVWRVIYRMAFRLHWMQRVQNRNVLILGAGKVGQSFREQIRHSPQSGLQFVGYLDDNPRKRESWIEILGTLDPVREVVNRMKVDDVVIALPRSADLRLNTVVSELHDLPVRVWVIPDYFSLTLHRASIEEFGGFPMLDLRAPALSEYQRMMKRGFDLTITLLAMPVLLPLIGLMAIAIRIDSSGTIFYRQKRMGENGRVFEMIKFRTMIKNADQMVYLVERKDDHGNIIHKVKDDPRVTRIGRFLRRMSLDEVPQLFNVLKGEMSLVGPRPEMPSLVEKYELWQRKRFAVPQGMTGWWQVNGRGDKPMHLHTDEDLYYVQHYSIWLDLQILLKTFWAVIRGKGAF
jgi:exopolysaccharide biosynthesis polyprenyl glycosylphosphotransferase